MKKATATSGVETNDTRHGVTDGDCDMDNAEDADSKPLLNDTETTTQIVTKRTNGRYDATDQESDPKAAAESDNENDTLIANSHN